MKNWILSFKYKLSDKKLLGLAACIVIGLLLGAFAEKINPFLDFHRFSIANGEFWRLLSANFVHLNFNHALMNMAALALVFVMFYEVELRTWLTTLFILSLFVSICLYFIDINLQRYVGLSGTLYGLWVFGALVSFKSNVIISLAVIGLMIFAVYQQQSQGFDDNYLQSWIGGTVIVNAHFYGLIGGFFLGGLKIISSYFFLKKQTPKV